MADLLGSILGSMDKPPTVGKDERKKAKAQKALIEKQQEDEKKELDKFRQKIEKRIHEFIQDATLEKLKMKPMEKVYRTIAHDVAEVAGLASFSFGHEEEDRYVMLWKKEFAPSDEELLAYRKGEEWDPEKARLAKLKEQEDAQAAKESMKSQQEVPASNYRDKYAHLIGHDSAKEAAKEMKSNTSYGFVPSTNKRDQRTIEQVLADSKAKKKQKLDDSVDVHHSEPTSASSSSHESKELGDPNGAS